MTMVCPHLHSGDCTLCLQLKLFLFVYFEITFERDSFCLAFVCVNQLAPCSEFHSFSLQVQ